MLVLSRKIGEQILIPELNITVTVLSAGPNRVQLGINAPKDINITRPGARHHRTVVSDVEEKGGRWIDQQATTISHVFSASNDAPVATFELAAG